MKSKVHNGLVHWPVKATPTTELFCPCRSLVLGGGADKALVLVEGDVRGQGAAAIVHGDDFDRVVLPDAEARVLGAEIDADNGGVGDGVE